MARKKGKGTELNVFKGREAKLNRAILQALALEGSQTVYDIFKKITTIRGLKRTRYASVNKRIKILESSGYVVKVAVKETKAGFRASIYGILPKAYLALLLNSLTPEQLLMRIGDMNVETILADILIAL